MNEIVKAPVWVKNLYQAFLQGVDTTRRTEALLLGEEDAPLTPALEHMLWDLKSKSQYGPITGTEEAFIYAMKYGTSLHQTLIRPTVAKIHPAIQNMLDQPAFFNTDFSQLKAYIQASMTKNIRTIYYQSMGRMFNYVTTERPPAAAPAWPAGLKGKKGPAPHKPFRNK